jgi:SAM-dependent methyltransferase
VNEHTARVAQYYDRNTEAFYLRTWDDEDIHFGLFTSGSRDRKRALKAMTHSIVASAQLTERDLVVDAGCGVGGAALDIAADTRCQVVGVNVSEVQLHLARTRAEGLGLSHRVRFVPSDCSAELPFEDASIDVLMTVEAACHFSDKARFLRECARILRPGGRLVASDWMRSQQVSPLGAHTLELVVDAWHLASLYSLSEWLKLLESVGFAVRESAEYGETVLENARLLRRAHMDLMLEQANGCHRQEDIDRWSRQYASLAHAWFAGHFTLGRLFATKTW